MFLMSTPGREIVFVSVNGAESKTAGITENMTDVSVVIFRITGEDSLVSYLLRTASTFTGNARIMGDALGGCGVHIVTCQLASTRPNLSGDQMFGSSTCRLRAREQRESRLHHLIQM